MTWSGIVARLVVPSLLLIPAKADHRVPSVTDPEAYAVYAALLPTNRDVVLIRSMTSIADYHCLPTGKPMEREWKSVVNNFKRHNTLPRVIQPRIPTNVHYELRPDETFTPHSLWSIGFYDAGNKITTMFLSSVGFDSIQTRALVYVASSCGAGCGKGMYQLLQKKAGRWEIVHPEGIDSCVAIE